jgi:hypothetical protein
MESLSLRLSLTLLLMIASLCPAQTREFSVSISGAGEGSYSQKATHTGIGTVEIAFSSEVHIKKFVVKYDYSFSGKEVWQDGRIISVTASRNDNGAVLNVSAKEGSCEWTSSYFRLPVKREGEIRVLDLDTGLYQVCRLSYIGADSIGKHWKLTGGITTDLWFGDNGYLVRREMLRKGRPTVVSLIRATK